MLTFNRIYHFAWLILIVLLVFLDRENALWVISSIILLLILAVIAVFRALHSRDEWREIIKDENLDKDIP
ncbi:MAG: hypothetical protein QGF36_03890 [Candidatus Marinimicrobia bacterium]|jgi:hypothetical protein|nr:hypothetical protein [Candidatus Neomarinimicrobiota bacterium]MDP6853027.1 hypothetical protein [Candidatus Neomarinimicrobiota bacterium]MDP6936556.1 hypothetical protein [Candidatus Neomarinimicrobiota bacterium]